MNKYTETFGIDISKDVFDVYGSKSGHDQFKNDAQGFKAFSKALPSGSLVVMEATGYYHYRLAQFLYKSGHIVQQRGFSARKIRRNELYTVLCFRYLCYFTSSLNKESNDSISFLHSTIEE